MLVCVHATAQISNDSLEYRLRPDAQRTGELHLSFENFNFLRNYEFYNRFQDGYTLYGSQVVPQLVYYPNANLTVMGGAYLRKDFGTRGVYDVRPLFSLKYQKNALAVIVGALEGSIHHRFIEPLYDVEKRITDPVEYGTQFTVINKTLFLDAFINWKRMIYKPSAEQEQILAGSSAEVKVWGRKQVTLALPLQVLVFHQGGQIDTVNQPLQTVTNTAVGLKLAGVGSGFIRRWSTAHYFAGYKELSPTKIRLFSSGSGWYLNAAADSRAGSVSASYWRGNRFIATNGMPLFQSVSQQINFPGYTARKRELLFLRYAWQKKLVSNLWLDVRAEPVFDLGQGGGFDFYHSLFFVYRQEFRLVKRGVR